MLLAGSVDIDTELFLLYSWRCATHQQRLFVADESQRLAVAASSDVYISTSMMLVCTCLQKSSAVLTSRCPTHANLDTSVHTHTIDLSDITITVVNLSLRVLQSLPTTVFRDCLATQLQSIAAT
jgi:hypothetical protein